MARRRCGETGTIVERGEHSPTIRTVVKLDGVLKVAPSNIVVRMEQFAGGREGVTVPTAHASSLKNVLINDRTGMLLQLDSRAGAIAVWPSYSDYE